MQHPSSECIEAFARDIHVFWNDVASVANPIVLNRSDHRRAYPHVRVEYFAAGLGKREDQSLYQFDWKLAWMNGLFDMIIFDIRENPDVARVFAQRIARELTSFWTFEIFLPKIF